MANLNIKNLRVSVEDKEVLKGISLTIKPGERHAIMGPNGSGKSTLASALAGHPAYEITHKKGSESSVMLGKSDLLEMSPDERAQAGLFLAFQYPVEVPGVKVQNFLRLAHQARFADQPKKLFKKVIDFRKHLQKLAESLKIKKEFLSRGLNEGFSGGEKKQLEILQMALLEPEFAILDETDSGLDIDAIKKVAKGVRMIQEQHQTGMMVITHYQRILQYLEPTHVHVLVNGLIVESGGPELAEKLEQKGYEAY